MPTEITMPQLSDTMTEGTVVKWNRKEGDKVKAGEEIAEVETDKATMPMESFEAGTVAFVAAKEGDKVKVGGLIAVLAVGKEDPAQVKAQYASGKKAQAPAAPAKAAQSAAAPPAPREERSHTMAQGTSNESAGRASTLTPVIDFEADQESSGNGGAVRSIDHPLNAGTSAATATPNKSVSHAGGNGHGGGRLFASPLARRVAADKGVDLTQIQGTGPGGRVVQRDVLEFKPAAKQSAAPSKAAAPAQPQRVGSGQKEVVPMTKMRTAIAAALQRSKQQIPHFYETIDIDVEELSALRGRVNEQLKSQNVKLSLADFIHKAVCASLLQHPNVNATFDEKKNEFTRHGDVHLGIAVAVPDGLIVPVLRAADQMGLKEMRSKSADIIDRARAQRLKQDEMSGGTFTVSSLGTFGIREFSAIINPPQVAILAVGAAEKRPVVRGEQIVPRTMMTVTLSADHRIVDGATAADFLRTLKSMLEEPGMMLV